MADQETSRRGFLAAAAGAIAIPSLSDLLSQKAEAGERVFGLPHSLTYFGPGVGQTGTIMHWGPFTVVRPYHTPNNGRQFQQQFVDLQPRQIKQRLCDMPQPFLTTGYVDDNKDGLTTMDELRNLNENCYNTDGELIFGIYNLPNGSRYDMHVRDSRGISVARGVGTTNNRIPANQAFDLERTMKTFGPGNYTAEFEVNNRPWAEISFGLADPEGKSLRGENNNLRWNQFDRRFPATFVSTGSTDSNGDNEVSIWEHDNPQLARYSTSQNLYGVASGLCNEPVNAQMVVFNSNLKPIRDWNVDIGSKRTASMNIGQLPAGDYMFSVKYNNSDYAVDQQFEVVDKRNVEPIAGITVTPADY